MTIGRSRAGAAARGVALLAFAALLFPSCVSYTSAWKPDPSARTTLLKVDPAAAAETSYVFSVESLPSAEAPSDPLRVKGSKRVTGPGLKVTRNVEQRYKNYWSPLPIPIGIIGVAEIPVMVLLSPFLHSNDDGKGLRVWGKGKNPKECEPNNFISATFHMSVGLIPTCQKVGEPKVTESSVPAGTTVTEEEPLPEFPLRVRLLADGLPLPGGKGERKASTGSDGRASVPLHALLSDLPDTAGSVEVEAVPERQGAASVRAPLPGAVVEALLGPVREERRGDAAASDGAALLALDHYGRAYGMAREEGARDVLFGKVASTYRGLPVKPVVPEEVRRLLVQAEALAKENDSARARGKLDEAIRLSPWIPAAWHNRAFALAMEKDYGGAIRSMEAYLRLVPEGPDARKAKDLVYQWETLVPPAAPAASSSAPSGERERKVDRIRRGALEAAGGAAAAPPAGRR